MDRDRLALRRLLTWLAPGLFLGLFFFYPLARILSYGLSESLLFGARTFSRLVDVLGFTFYQAGGSTLLTLALGLPAAYLFARFEFPGRVLLRTLTSIPFMLPALVVAAAFSALVGPRGWVNVLSMRLLGLDSPPLVLTGALSGIFLAHVFYNTTIIIRVVGNALASLDPRLEAAARMLGASAWQAFWRVTAPVLRLPLLAAALLVFLFNFTSFGVILLLGGPQFATLEVEIYLQALSFFNLPLAALLSLVQLMCTLAVSVLYSRLAARALTPLNPRAAQENRRPARTWRERLFVTAMASLLLLFFALPLLSLPLRSITRLEADRAQRSAVTYGLTGDYYQALFANPRGALFYVPPAQAMANSLGYAGMTVILSLMIGFPAAAALARPGRLERLLDPLLMLPLGASAVTLGLGFILTFSRPPLNVISAPWFVPVAHTLVALPFVIRALQPALASIPLRLREAAATLGASPLQVWQRVDAPIAARAVASAAVFAFTVSLGEFGATLLIARPEYPTLTTAIFRFLSQPGGLNYGQAMAMSTLLMLLTLLGILLIERLRVPGTGDF